ncbi:S41 family peptidase [Labrys neptuniae]|uniref:S41 family peptidase n=1 Tax=Labrys TaxID=204476 RepID=UPI00289177B1|nr:S41 family peptidase [Labrys neptuniae]MDT3377259.1 S41 family peptidase [Labrys neptuniae]
MRMRPLAIAVLLLGLIAVPVRAQQQPDPENPDNDTREQLYELGRFIAIYQRVLATYVDKPAPDVLIQGAIGGMMSKLDPHSRYVDPKAMSDMQQELAGKRVGLGLEVEVQGGLVKVEHVLDATPAATAGLKAGDIILKLDGDTVRGLSPAAMLQRMEGAVGSSATLTIRRRGNAVPLSYTLMREIIRAESVRFEVMGEDVGYIRIREFNEQTPDSLRRVAERLPTAFRPGTLKGIVLDLRNNPGGLLDPAIMVSAAFIGKGVLLSIRGREPDQSKVYIAHGEDITGGVPLVVLINGGTASAAEIVAGALQDFKRATILGTRSFGKGSIQTVTRLPDDSALVLTTARYYTPLGRSIQAQGIEPDIAVRQQDPTGAGLGHATPGEAGLTGHLRGTGLKDESGSSLYVPPNPTDDIQLRIALDMLRSTERDRSELWRPPGN